MNVARLNVLAPRLATHVGSTRASVVRPRQRAHSRAGCSKESKRAPRGN